MTAPFRFRIEGVIGDDFRATDLLDFLASANGAPVSIEIHSPGGSVWEALAAYNALVEYTGLVTITVDAIAASAAALIFVAGDNRVMKAGALLMVHRASGLTAGNTHDHGRTADVLAKIDRQVVQIFCDVTGLAEARMMTLLDAETWMNAEEALALGFATEDSTQPVTASIEPFLDQLTHYRKPPAAIRALANMHQGETPMPKLNTETDTTVITSDLGREIFAMGKRAGLNVDEIDDVLSKAKDIRAAHDLVIDAVTAKAGDQTVHRYDLDGGGGDSVQMATAVTDYFMARMTSKPIDPKSPGKALEGRRLTDVFANAYAPARGIRIRSHNPDRLTSQMLAPSMVAGGMNSTSDFVELLIATGNRILGDAFMAAQSPLKLLARRCTSNDFRKISKLRLGEQPALLEVPEGGEVTYGSRASTAESFSLLTYARIFSLTRQAIINDDLGAFADAITAWAQAAATLEANLIYAKIANGGPTMSDGHAVFSTEHGNILHDELTPNGMTALTSARKLMRAAKGIDGTTPLIVDPAFLLVGPELETAAQQLVSAIAPVQFADVQPIRPTVLVEPRITDESWYLFANPGQAEVLSYANLADRTSPEIQTREGWTVLGIESRCVHDFGIGITDYRGGVYSDGAGLTG